MIESLVLENQLPLGLAVNYIALGEEQSGDIDIDEPDVILILERQLGIQTSGSQTTVGAVAADEQTAELIGVALGAPRVWLTDSRGRCPSSGCAATASPSPRTLIAPPDVSTAQWRSDPRHVLSCHVSAIGGVLRA